MSGLLVFLLVGFFAVSAGQVDEVLPTVVPSAAVSTAAPYTATPMATETHAPTEAPTAVPTIEPPPTPDATVWVRVDTRLNLRTGPGVDYDRILVIISAGEDKAYVPLLDEQDGWYYVRYIDREGWIDSTYATVVEGEPEIRYTQDMAIEQFQEYFSHKIDCENDDPADGYYYLSSCIPVLIDVGGQTIRYPAAVEGKVGRYDHGVMESVLQNRGVDASGYLGAVAIESCAHIGESVWLDFGGGLEGPYLVADCSERYGMFYIVAWMEFVVEVDANTVDRIVEQGLWQGWATVCFSNPCSAAPISFSEYWLERIGE
jgi:hypothetical protein